METTPDWVKGIEPNPHNQHMSGQLRELSDAMWHIEEIRELCIFLSEAAEKLDDAHEHWLESQDPAAFKGMT